MSYRSCWPRVGVAARIAAEHRRRFGRRGTQHAGGEYRLGCPAGSVHSLLPVVSHQEEAEPMHGSLPGVQRQHQPPLWKLWSLRLLPDGDGLLQRDMHGLEFGREQLRRLRIRLRRGDAYARTGLASRASFPPSPVAEFAWSRHPTPTTAAGAEFNVDLLRPVSMDSARAVEGCE